MRTLLPSPVVAVLATVGVLLLTFGLETSPASAKDEATRGLRYPSLSADGKLVTFAYRGDIWVAETSGSRPRITRLTIHEAQDTLPRFSPDGKFVAFSSQREGSYDIFVVSVDGGVPERVTYHSGFEIVSDWSKDGKQILMLSSRDVESAGMDAYVVPVTGGTPRRMTFDGNARDVSYSADGKQLVYARGTNSIYQDNYEGSANYDIWTIPVRETGQPMPDPKRITHSGGNERYPFFSGDDKHIFVVAEEKGVANFYKIPAAGGKRVKVTKFKGADVQRPQIGFDHKHVVFERQGRLFTTDLTAKDPKAKALDLHVRSDVRHSGIVTRAISKGTQQVHVSHDGGRLAFSVHGDIWTMSGNGGNAKRVTTGVPMDEWPRWSPDGKTIAFQSDRSGNSDIWLMDAKGGSIRQLTKHKSNDFFHNWSPDGRTLVFCSERSGNRDIWKIDAQTGAATRLTSDKAADDDPSFSPDGRLIAFDSGRGGPQAIYVMGADGSNVRQVTGGRGFLQVPSFSNDGRFVIYESFVPQTGRSGGIFVTSIGGGPSMQLSRDGSAACWSPRGDYVYFTAGPRGGEEIYRVAAPKAIENRERVAFHGTVQIDTKSELADLFEEAWRQLQRGFYDPKMHGVDWNAMKKKYKQMAVDAEIKDEFQNVIRQMLAELNASHLGIRGGDRPSNAVPTHTAPTGYIGAQLSDDASKGGGRKIISVMKRGPADAAGLRVGDEITHVNKKKLGAGVDLDRILTGAVGKTIEVRYRPITEDGLGDARRSELKPIHSGQVRQMAYGAWLKRTSSLVKNKSKGRLGYVHLTGMDPKNLQKFRNAVNVWNQNKRIKGMVLDVRNNGGGNIHNQLMQILLSSPYAYVRPRGAPAKIPQPAVYWDKPVIVLCNERSFSDAEVFPHIFQAAGRGKVVGVPTPGGVIGTNDITLSDGTVFRIPRVGYYALDGTNLEGTGVKPDIIIEETPADLRAKRDPQLQKAIEVVLAETRKKAAAAKAKPATGSKKPKEPKKPATTPDQPKPDTPKPDAVARKAGALDPLADVKKGEWVRYDVRMPTLPEPIKLRITVTEANADNIVAEPVVEEGPPIPFPLPREWANKPLLETLTGLGTVASHKQAQVEVDGKSVDAVVANVEYGGATLRMTFTNALPGWGLFAVEMNKVVIMQATEWGIDEVADHDETPAEGTGVPQAPSGDAAAEASGIADPLYDAKPGEWIRMWTFNPRGEKIVSIVKVTEVTDDAVILQSTMEGADEAFDPIRRPRRKELSSRGRRGGKRTVTKETVEIGGHKLECTVITRKGRRGETRQWISNDVAVTGLVRRTRNGKVVAEVIDWGSDDAPKGTSQER